MEKPEDFVEEITETSKLINGIKQENMGDKNIQNDSSAHENHKNESSEYESVEYESVGSSIEGVENNTNLDNENDYESNGSVILEREEGDGQESVSTKKVDDDEDKKNPQYIPKRGTFYEHDDRTLEDGEDKEETADKTDKQNKKNVWMEKKERWSHDRYNDNDQAPKSRTELVSIYGYDIRNEDGPPKARRRRRYGRGPNKYTRTWEDEDAYKPTKPLKPVKPKSKNKDDYPSSNECDSETNKNETAVFGDKDNTEEDFKSPKAPLYVETKVSPNNVPREERIRQEPFKKPFTSSNSDQSNFRPQHRVGTGRIVKYKPEIKQEIKDSDYRGFTKTRHYRNSKLEQKVLAKNYPTDGGQKRSSNEHSSMENIDKELNQLSIQDESSKLPNKHNNQRQNTVPPRLQAEQRPKRYSSLRQRSLPETAAPTYNQAANYYSSEYNPSTSSVQQQTILTQPSTILAATSQVPQIAPPPLPALAQVSVTSNPILQAPPQFAAPFPQAPPAFLPPAVASPQFLPQQPPQIINYVQSQAQFPPGPPYQGYPHQQFNAVNQAAELYQCQGGTTYYSTQNQHLGQRLVPQKRPKAAIPIVPPPPLEPRGRGRLDNFRESPSHGEEMCELMHENYNNYEDSIVYVQQ